MSGLLKNTSNAEVDFPENGGYIGKGSFSKCYRCWLKSDPLTMLVVKKFELDTLEPSMKDWLLKHLVKEVLTMHNIGQQSDAFVRVCHLYNQDSKLVGYTMPYYRHGSLRLFSARLPYLGHNPRRCPWLMAQWMQQVADGFDYLHSRRSDGGIIHRDLAVDNVLIDDSLRAKIADFGLSKKMVHSVSTQRTLDFEVRRGIERRLPETYDDVLRQPDQFGDRYQYGIFVIEGFGQLSLRQVIGDRIEEFKLRVKSGEHLADFLRLLDDACFNKLPASEAGPQLERLRSTAKQVVEKMTQQEPQKRATFAEVTGLWQLCDQGRMEAERLRVLDQLRELPPDATIPSSGNRQTVSLGRTDDAAAAAAVGAAAVVPPSVSDRGDSVGDSASVSAAAARQQQQQQQQPPIGLNISIGTVLGDVHTFRQPAAASLGGGSIGGQVRVLQTMDQPQGDEPDLLRRTYAEEVADEALLLSLCRSVDVASRWWVLLTQLGCTAVDMERLNRPGLIDDADRLLQDLRRLRQERRLTVSELGEALKRCGCLAGLRILRRWESDAGLPTM